MARTKKTSSKFTGARAFPQHATQDVTRDGNDDSGGDLNRSSLERVTMGLYKAQLARCVRGGRHVACVVPCRRCAVLCRAATLRAAAAVQCVLYCCTARPLHTFGLFNRLWHVCGLQPGGQAIARTRQDADTPGMCNQG